MFQHPIPPDAHRSLTHRLQPALLLLLLAAGIRPDAAAQVGEREFPITVNRITDRIIVVATGATPAMPNVTAVRTDDGIVVFDTGMIPERGKDIRAAIEQAFGSTDIDYLVLTHAAYDHSFGDIAYPDVPIIGHSDVPRALGQYVQQFGAEGLLARFEESVERMRQTLDQLPFDYEGFDERLAAEESADSILQMVRALAGGFRPLEPTIVFSDSLTLFHGGLTFRMHVGAGVYEQSNILIEIPELNTVLLGDEFNKERLPVLGRNGDIDRLQSEMIPYLEREEPVARFIPGHGKLVTAEEISEQITYAVDLKKAVEAAKAEGLTLEEAQQRLRFDAFGHLQHLPRFFYGYPVDGHETNIRSLWRRPAP